jgi:hypothetical protein
MTSSEIAAGLPALQHNDEHALQAMAQAPR